MTARPRRTLRILAVDDDPRVLAAVTQLLRAEGLDVRAADGPDAARTRAGARAALDVALVDVRLPDPSTGLALIRDLARIVPVVATSLDPTLRAPALVAGAHAFSDKNGLVEDLLTSLHATAAPKEPQP
jgi:CheY-like chemotaxis protein